TLFRTVQAGFDSDGTVVSVAGAQSGGSKVHGMDKISMLRIRPIDGVYLGGVLCLTIEVIWEHGGGLRPLDRPIWPCTGQFFQCGDLPPAPQAVFGKARVQLSAVWTQIRSR